MAEKYIGIEKFIFADTYNLFLKYKDIPDEAYYWEKCIEDSKALQFKYHNHPLATSLTVAVLDQLEHKICKRNRKDRSYIEWESIILNK